MSSVSTPVPPVRTALAHDGPRERLQLRGAQELSNAELLSVLLGTGSSSEPVSVVAERLLREVGGLSGLLRAGLEQLGTTPGVGVVKACRIQAALELGMRAASVPLRAEAPIRSSRDVHAALGPRLRACAQEHFYVIAVDAKHRPLSEILVARGGLTACALTPADVFRPVLRVPAHAVVFVHNHPSGDPAPSDADVALTRKLAEAGALLGLSVLDHVIVGASGYFSFMDAGLLPIHPGLGGASPA